MDLDPEFTEQLQNYCDGTLAIVAELIQTKRDLARTKHAEMVARQRRASKNRVLQVGGVLTVSEGREMVRIRDQDDVEKARRVVAAADAKERTSHKRWYEAVAKEARRRRLTIWGPCDVYDTYHDEIRHRRLHRGF